MVDKFKQEKDVMKDQARKEDAKNVGEVNKLHLTTKKLKDELDEFRDKLTRRESYVIAVEKLLKSEKDKSQEQ